MQILLVFPRFVLPLPTEINLQAYETEIYGSGAVCTDCGFERR